jgi:hypothetical protein
MGQFFASTDWAVVVATFVGPIAAVVISLELDSRARQRERRISVLNGLLQGRASMLGPLWTQSILQVPLEFRKDDAVMSRWEEFYTAAQNNTANETVTNDLIKAILKTVGFADRPAGQIVRSGYRSNGLELVEKLQKEALEALPEVAKSAARSATAAEEMLSMLKQRPDPPPTI